MIRMSIFLALFTVIMSNVALGDKFKVEVVKIGGRKVKGANGEMLTPIKLRVVGYKWNEQNLSI